MQENIGEIISSDVKNSAVYSGYIESNKENGTSYQTEFNEITELMVSAKGTTDKVCIDEENTFVDVNNKEIDIRNDLIYKSTKISKYEMQRVLGEDGIITIETEDGTVIKEINKDTKELEDGMVEIVYSDDVNKIVIKTSKPQKEGIITFIHKRAIKDTMLNTDVRKIMVKQNIDGAECNEKGEEERFRISYCEKEIKIDKAESRIDVSLDQTNFTNRTQNNANITATLITNSNQYRLFKNPIIEIELPSQVEKLVLGNVSTLYDNSLRISKAEVVKNNLGNNVIRIELEGNQTEYKENSISKGFNIVIPVVIILNTDIESGYSQIKVRYSNENEGLTYYQNLGNESQDIDIKIDSIKNETLIFEEIKDGEVAKENNALIDANNFYNVEQSSLQELISENAITVTSYAQVGDKILKDSDSVHEKEVIKYVVTLKNNSNTKIDNISVVGKVPDNTTYATINMGTYHQEAYDYIPDTNVKEYKFPITSLEAGEEKTEFYEVIVNDLGETIDEDNIENQINLLIEGQQYKNITLDNVINKARISTDFKVYMNRDTKLSFVYYLHIKNLTNQSLKNVKIETTEFQKVMNVQNTYLFDSNMANSVMGFGSIENGKFEGTIEELKPNEKKIVEIAIHTSNFPDEVNEYPLSMSAVVTMENGDEYYSNQARRNAYPEYVTAKISLDREGEKVKAGEELTYTLTIKNESKIKTTVHIQDKLPEEVEGISLEYDKYIVDTGTEEEGEEETEYDIEAEANLNYTIEHEKRDLSLKIVGKSDVDESLIIPAGKELVITVKVKTKSLIKTVEVTNYVQVSGIWIKSVTSNLSKFTLLAAYEETIPGTGDIDDTSGDKEEPSNPQDPSTDPTNPDSPTDTRKSISGMVWNDLNKDGKRDNGESGIKGIIVKLYNADTNLVMQKDNGDVQKVVTGNDGKYTFFDVPKGKYLVLFEFDTSKYSLTVYQELGVNKELNSDAILKNVSIDGVEKNVGLTDNLLVESEDLFNIDMGLTKNSVLDLSLEKGIREIKVTNSLGETVYSYNDVKLAKIEIDAKKVSGSSVVIKYAIKVKNEGDVEAYVDKVIDYLPDGLELAVNEDINWMKDENENLINTSLSKTVILPGETKELTLTVKKQMTNDSIGVVKNIAEIGGYTTAENLSDIDSKPENKISTEDDYSEAEIIVSIRTGIVKYTIIGIIAILVLVLLIILINKKLISKNSIKTIMKVIIFVSCTLVVMCSNVSEAVSYAHKANSLYINGYDGTFTGNDKKSYHCGHAGWHQCVLGDDGGQPYHWYGDGKATNKDSTTKTTTEKEDITLTADGSAITVTALSDGNFLVGPYKVKCNYAATLDSITLNYKNVNGTLGTSTDKALITNSAGTQITNFAMSKNKNFTFYLKLGSDVARIEGLTVNAIIQDAYKTVTKYTWKCTHTCTSLTGSHYKGHSSASDTQPMYHNRSKSETKYSDATKSQQFGAVDISGALKITKTGNKTNPAEKLSGVSFNITGPNNYNNTLQTDANGEINLSGLVVGQYTVKETAVSNNTSPGQANYGYLVNTNNQYTLTVTPGGTASYTFTNSYYLSPKFTIVKKDKNTGAVLANVKFSLKMTSGEKNGLYVYKDANGNAAYSSVKQILATDANGKIEINNIWAGNYTLTEEETLKGYGKIDPLTGTIGNSEVTVNVENERKYIDITGFAWEDVNYGVGKNKVNNYLYKYGNDDVNDKLLDNVKVYLINKNNNSIVMSTTTQNGGKYKFEKVEINQLSNYRIEFEYNGLGYQSFENQYIGPYDSYKNIRSFAKEEASTRTAFNGKFKEITNNKIVGGPFGQNRVAEKSVTYTEFDKGYGSKFNYPNGVNGYSGANIPIYCSDTDYLIRARTVKDNILEEIGKTTDNIRKEGLTVISDVNIGLIERNMPDLRITNDIDNAKIVLSGNEYVYNYPDSRYSKVEKEKEANVSSTNKTNSLNIGVKFADETGGYKGTGFTREIYSSDCIYNKNHDDFGVYITYKISVINESTIYSKVNVLTNYFDKRCTVYKIGTTKDNEDILKAGTYSGNPISGNDSYNYININLDTNSNGNISAGDKSGSEMNANVKQIYITYKLTDEAINNVLNGNVTLETVTEISSYSSYSDANYSVLYAGIDKDSNPGNVNINEIANNKNYRSCEDDTDTAPSLILNLVEGRKIQGTVWEDSAIQNLLNLEGQQKERIGNGIYDSGEGVVKGVTVELLRKEEQNGNQETYGLAKLYQYIKENNNYVLDNNGQRSTVEKDAIVETNEKGEYSFVGVIPGEYKIKYTYGDKSIIINPDGTEVQVVAESYKSTVYRTEYSEQRVATRHSIAQNDFYWYKNEITKNSPDGSQTAVERRWSDAKDDQDIVNKRINIKEITNSKTVDANGNKIEGLSEDVSAYTEVFKIDMDYVADAVNKKEASSLKMIFDNFDFGIIERPKQDLKITKNIIYIDISYTNGTSIIKGNPQTDNINYLKSLPGIVAVEMDKEDMQGATLNVTYSITVDDTNCEIDYNSQDYYNYGIKEGDMVIATIKQLVDYIPNSYSYDISENEDKWSRKSAKELYDEGLISEDVYKVVKDYNNIVVTTFNEITTKSVELKVSKLLSNTKDELNFINDTEIIRVSGRKITGEVTVKDDDGTESRKTVMTPGNYIPVAEGGKPYQEPDDGTVQLLITTPTGENRDMLTFTIIGVSSLLILCFGLVLIKKFILK